MVTITRSLLYILYIEVGAPKPSITGVYFYTHLGYKTHIHAWNIAQIHDTCLQLYCVTHTIHIYIY